MMGREEIFAVWSPPASPWSVWVKPVLFAQIDTEILLATGEGGQPPALEQPPAWLPGASERMALVIDCPGPRSVWLGMASAALGYRPIPLFNALPGPTGSRPRDFIDQALLPAAPVHWPSAVVDVRSTMSAMILATPVLQQLDLPDDAPPAFLLDANRRSGSGPLLPGRFDNRSVAFPTDFPSANFLLGAGIKKALLIQERALVPEADLAHTLLRWQQAGIRIESAALEGASAPAECFIPRPTFFRWVWYRLRLLAGLRPDLGGFGGLIPEPSSSG